MTTSEFQQAPSARGAPERPSVVRWQRHDCPSIVWIGDEGEFEVVRIEGEWMCVRKIHHPEPAGRWLRLPPEEVLCAPLLAVGNVPIAYLGLVDLTTPPTLGGPMWWHRTQPQRQILSVPYMSVRPQNWRPPLAQIADEFIRNLGATQFRAGLTAFDRSVLTDAGWRRVILFTIEDASLPSPEPLAPTVRALLASQLQPVAEWILHNSAPTVAPLPGVGG